MKEREPIQNEEHEYLIRCYDCKFESGADSQKEANLIAREHIRQTKHSMVYGPYESIRERDLSFGPPKGA